MRRWSQRPLLVMLALAAGGGCDDLPPPGATREASSPSGSAAPSAPVSATVSAAAASPSAPVTAARRLVPMGEFVDEESLLNAPIVSLKGGELRVDTELVASSKELAPHAKKVGRIEALALNLRVRMAKWKEYRPGQPFPGVVVIDAEDSSSAVLFKSVFQTAIAAGYPNLYVVEKAPAPR